MNPTEGLIYYFVAAGAVAFGSFLRLSFLKRHGKSEILLASRELICGLVPLALFAVLLVGNGDVFRATVGVITANVLAAQAYTLLTRHATEVANIGDPNFEVGGADSGFFACILRCYSAAFPDTDEPTGNEAKVGVLRPVALVLIWILFMLYNQVGPSLPNCGELCCILLAIATQRVEPPFMATVWWLFPMVLVGSCERGVASHPCRSPTP